MAHRARHPSQTPQDQAVNSTTEELKLDDNRFRGLTPPPMADLTPRRKRALEEVIEDTTPPEQDKLSQELEKLAGKVSSADGDKEPDEEDSDGKSTGAPSTRRNVGNDRSPRKRVKLRALAPKKSEAPA